MQTSHLHPNVRHLLVYAMFSELSFMIPVIIAFAAWRGVTFAQFIAIQAMFSVVMILFNPIVSPLADLYGRRRAVIAGSVFWTLGHVLILLGHGWQSYAVAEILLGIGVSAFRPAKEALLYDSLKSAGREDAHYAALTRQNSLMSYAGALAMTCGGWMYLVHPTAPVIATIVSNLTMLVVAWRLVEAPYHTNIAARTATYGQMWQQAWQSMSAVHTRWLVVLPGIISGSTITLFWSIQPTLAQAGVGAGVVSLLMGAYFVARGWFAGWCPRLVEKFTGRQCFALCVAAMGMGFVSVALLPWWLAYPPFIAGAGFSYILADTLGREMVHRHVASAIRSTAIGGFQLASRLVGVATLGACSLLQPVVGLPQALLAIGLVVTVLGAASLARLPR